MSDNNNLPNPLDDQANESPYFYQSYITEDRASCRWHTAEAEMSIVVCGLDYVLPHIYSHEQLEEMQG